MNKTIALVLGASLLASGCATATTDESAMAAKPAANPAITQAEADVKKAKSMSAEWRMLDKGVGKKAQNISKVLKIAKEKQAAGEVEEATRLAEKISDYVMMGLAQAEDQKDAKPAY